MGFVLVPMSESAANRIADWQYDPPYDFYDLKADPDDYEEFMHPPDCWQNTYAVETNDGTLVGFFSFSPEDRTLEVGLGMHPEYTDQGLGREFVETGLRYAQTTYDPDTFELAVASFNKRAISVYEAAGFERVEVYIQETNGGEYEFLRMQRDVG